MNTHDLDTCRQTVVNLFKSYFERRDPRPVIEALMPDVICIGPGDEAVCHGRTETIQLFQREFELFAGRFTTLEKNVDCKELAPGVYALLIQGNVIADADPESFAGIKLLISLVMLEQEGRYHIQLLHVSTTSPDLKYGEIFNLQTIPRKALIPKAALMDAARETAEQLKETDSLTGLPDTTGFERHARQLMWVNPHKQYAMVRFELSSFQSVNQQYGYETGDLLLKEIAKGLRRFCRAGEACARIERDNFVLLLEYPGSLEQLFQRLRAGRHHLLSQETVQRTQCKLSAIAGIYLPKPGGQEEVKSMLYKALLAQLDAKGSGYGDRCSVFNEEMEQQVNHNEILMERAPDAMRNGEFQLYIQPQVRLDTLEPISGEALVRWIPPENGKEILPGKFIPLFEQNNFILELDLYLLEQLCKQMRRWLDLGIDVLPIAINQSRKHLLCSNYIHRFCEIVDRYDIPHRLIIYEITESALAENQDEITDLSQSLQKSGFPRAIDDFGAGFTSPKFLELFPPDILKVDRGLIANLDRSKQSRIILKKVIELAQDMDVCLLCEGIETEEQLDFLRKHHCQYGQGFYFYHPMPIDRFETSILHLGPQPAAHPAH